MKIYFDGKESTIIKIMANLPNKGNAIALKATHNSITIPCVGQAFIGDSIVIDGDSVTIEDY